MSEELHLAVEVERLCRKAGDSKMRQTAREAIWNGRNCRVVGRPHLFGVLDHSG